TVPPVRTVMPLKPVLSPSKSSPRSTTTSVAFGTLTTIPLVPDTNTPASKHSEEMVIGLVIVTAPKPPGSRTLISPPEAVLEIAPAKVLHGAVRLHGFASSPTPDTQVRVAWACATVANPAVMVMVAKRRRILEDIMVFVFGVEVADYRRAVRIRNFSGPSQHLSAFTRNPLRRRAPDAAHPARSPRWQESVPGSLACCGEGIAKMCLLR